MWKEYGLTRIFAKFDLFQKPLPTFNIRGNDSVPSVAGGCMSFVAMSILLVYGLMKMQTLLLRDSPNVSSRVDRHSIP